MRVRMLALGCCLIGFLAGIYFAPTLYYTDSSEYEVCDGNTPPQKVRVLCWILTATANHASKAKHVYETWGKRCTIVLFMSTQADSSLPVVKLNVKEGRAYLWGKTKASLQYIYANYFNHADWFLKADDDTFVIVENLQRFLVDYDTREAVHFGRRLKADNPSGFMSGGAGYVLSKEALRRVVEDALPRPDLCKASDEGMEDIELGQCLDNVGITALDSRDRFGRERFHPFVPEAHLVPGVIDAYNDWFNMLDWYSTKPGRECCSNSAISFHYVSPNMMYVLDYLIYRVNPYKCRADDTEEEL